MQSLYSSLVFRYCCIIGVYSATQLPRYLFYLIYIYHYRSAHFTYAVRTREVFDFAGTASCNAHYITA